MPKYAIAHANLFDNELDIMFVEADSWQQALARGHFISEEDIANLNSIEELKEQFFNMDALIHVSEIPT